MTTTQAVKERPILFDALAVRAILTGKKTQTRLVMKPQPERKSESGEHWWPSSQARMMVDVETFLCGDDKTVAGCFWPHGEPGDHLWVRETFCVLDRDHWTHPSLPKERLTNYGEPRRNGCAYRAGCSSDGEEIRRGYGYKWTSSVGMPRWASRITLEIEDVRVERLQDIRVGGYLFKSDAQKEGCPFENDPAMFGQDEAAWFKDRWDATSGKGGYDWDTNPWVWVIDFKRLGK